MNSFWHALAFLTRIPVPRLSSSQADWERSAGYYPLIGLLIGAYLCLNAMVFGYVLPAPAAAVMIVVAWVYITGGLHLDGWMDLADGLGSNRPRERVLEIMKDSRVGAMGVIAAVLLLVWKIVATYQLLQAQWLWLLLPPLVARFALLVAMKSWPYVSDKGLGQGLRDHIRPHHLVLGGILVLVCAGLFVPLIGIVAVVLSVCVGLLFARYAATRLGGMTGDVYGAVVEFVEAAVLLFSLVAIHRFG